jgi:protein-disulfide isomerase
VVGLIVVVTVKNNKAGLEKNKPEVLSFSDAKTQSYVASSRPELREDDKIFGSKKALLKVFVYEDNSSIYSAQLADTLDKIYSENSDDIAIIVRPYAAKNASFVKEAALAVECAGDQEKWTAMRALLFAKVKNESLNPGEFGTYAEQINLDKEDFLACLTNTEKSAKIEELRLAAEKYNVVGAPTMFIDEEIVLGARPYEDYVDSNGDKIEGLKTLIARKIK